MKPAKILLPGILALALFMSCGEIDPNKKYVAYELRGVWESTDTDYSGTLVIGFDTITITGYDKSQTPQTPPWPPADDAMRPFRDFAKNVSLGCYTEEGELFIQTSSGMQGVPYIYQSKGQERSLLFSFGKREEALKRTAGF